ncbi:MAG: hypothetical protein MJ172_05330 [Clostridia bacterium]|nr:hypothetical protein [Clostridia bacterium]
MDSETNVEIKENFLKTNTLLIKSIIFAIILLVLCVAALTVIVTSILNEDIDVNRLSFCSPVCLASGMFFILNLQPLADSIKGVRANNRLIKKYGLEELLTKMNREAVYIYEEKGKPRTVITPEYIFERNVGVYDSKLIDYIYYRNYKGTTSVRMYDLNNKHMDIARGVTDELKKLEVLDAICKVNPTVLRGFIYENDQEHKARVKAHKKNKK